MLTAILLQSGSGNCLAPGPFLIDPEISAIIQGIVPARYWLTDRAEHGFQGQVILFAKIDPQLLEWVDCAQEFFLVSGRDHMRDLLPMIDKLLIINFDQLAGWPKTAAIGWLPELDDPGKLGYQLQSGTASTDPLRPAIWQRSSAADLVAQVVAAGDCDLHLHTNQSDGTDTPEELVDRVFSNGLQAFAITDHDNLSALKPARLWLDQQMAGSLKPQFIPGVELSIDDKRELHLLGYFPRGGIEVIEGFLTRQREERRFRNIRMIQELQMLGYLIDLSDFEASGEGTIGRLQAAIILRDKGYFPTISDAFSEMLGYGRPAYFERSRPAPAEAIFLIRQAGGVAVLAHPGLYGWCSGQNIVSKKLLNHLENLKKYGLQGVEAFHGEASAAVQREISAAARVLGLIRTCGSDDHGINKEHTHLYAKGTSWLAESEILVAAALISGPPKAGEPTWLLARRSTPGSGYGFWEFPGGKVEPGETPANALARELLEELAVTAEIGERQMVLTYEYPERRVILAVLKAYLEQEDWQYIVHDCARYVTASEALSLKLLPADVLIFEALQQSVN